MMNRLLRIFIAIFLCLVYLYVIGPLPPNPELKSNLPKVEVELKNLDNYLREKESKLPVKPGNESVVVWANDSLKHQTEWSLLYLHGFSASRMEGFPTHVNFAQYFDMNAYLPRLASHGLDVPEPLLNMTPDSLYNSAKEALQIAQLLGQKVIIMSTSTGGTLSLKLAAEFPDLIDGLILFSPNVAINNPAAFLLSKPWGLQIARAVHNGKFRYITKDPEEERCAYWNCFYRLEAVVYLQQLIDATMTPRTFHRVKVPVFMGYYYKDETHQDDVIRVDAALKMFDQLATLDELKQKQAFDSGNHGIGSVMFSRAQKEVEEATIRFAEDVLKISKLKTQNH